MEDYKKETVYITGHKNPDTDSVIAAIAYAEFKNKISPYHYEPVRLGELNRETKFILDYFGVEVPMMIDTVKLQVKDLNYDKKSPVEQDISLKMAWNLMNNNGANSLVVVDENEFLKGVVTVSNLTSCYMDVWDNGVLSKSNTNIDNIIDTTTGVPLNKLSNPRPITGKMVVISMTAEDADTFLEEGDIVIVGNMRHSHEIAIQNRASVIIITGNHTMDDDLLKEATEDNIQVVQTPFDTFTAARLLPQAVPISFVMTKDKIIHFSINEFVNDIKNIMTDTRFRSYPIVNNENKVVGTISRYHLISQKKKKVILVDHNERTQSVDGLEDAEILEIIDHHRVADVATGSPIYFRNEPVGSTSTIVSSIFFENGIRPSRKVAGLLSAAIISDTLFFKSPTSTQRDRMNLEKLAKIIDLDVEKFAMDMFKAGTSLEGKTPEQLLKQDFKTFTIADQKIGISQVYSLDASALESMKEDLVKVMEERAKNEGFTIYGLLITDIFKESSDLILVGPSKELLEKAFHKEIINHCISLPGVLSRKKQVIPVVTNVIMNNR